MAQGAQIIWSKKALTLLSEAAAFLADLVGDQKANAFQIDLVNYVDTLLHPFPEGCPPCRFRKLKDAGCRCCVYKKKYIVIFRYEAGVVKIIGVLGAHRNPKLFEDLI